MDDKAKIAEFLREYRELCERHGLMVGGNWDPYGLWVSEVNHRGVNELDGQIKDFEIHAGLREGEIG